MGILHRQDLSNALIHLPEKARPKTQFWTTLLDIARAEVFVYNGQVDEGLPLALRAAELSQQQGHRRRLERIYGMRRFLNRKAIEFAKAEEELGDILDGPVARWDKIG